MAFLWLVGREVTTGAYITHTRSLVPAMTTRLTLFGAWQARTQHHCFADKWLLAMCCAIVIITSAHLAMDVVLQDYPFHFKLYPLCSGQSQPWIF